MHAHGLGLASAGSVCSATGEATQLPRLRPHRLVVRLTDCSRRHKKEACEQGNSYPNPGRLPHAAALKPTCRREKLTQCLTDCNDAHSVDTGRHIEAVPGARNKNKATLQVLWRQTTTTLIPSRTQSCHSVKQCAFAGFGQQMFMSKQNRRSIQIVAWCAQAACGVVWIVEVLPPCLPPSFPMYKQHKCAPTAIDSLTARTHAVCCTDNAYPEMYRAAHSNHQMTPLQWSPRRLPPHSRWTESNTDSPHCSKTECPAWCKAA